MYRNQPNTQTQLELIGYADLATKLLAETNKPILITRSYLIEFPERKSAKRLQKLLYELFHEYPDNKTRISFRLEDTNLRISLVNKEETRGRKSKDHVR